MCVFDEMLSDFRDTSQKMKNISKNVKSCATFQEGSEIAEIIHLQMNNSSPPCRRRTSPFRRFSASNFSARTRQRLSISPIVSRACKAAARVAQQSAARTKRYQLFRKCWLIFGCIGIDFCKQMFIVQHSIFRALLFHFSPFLI